MVITTIEEFLPYYEKVRSRTLNVIHAIPPERIEWTYKEGKFTFGDLIRHIAAIERFMYAENAQFKPSKYNGCDVELASGYDEVIAFMSKMHNESLAIFSGLSPEDLQKKCETPAGVPITLWKWLRSMVEHEIHHRGQIFIYLGALGVASPTLYGLTAEQVQERSKSQ